MNERRTDLDRLLEGSPSPRTRALLRAGTAETSPDQFAERLLASVAAAAAVGAVTHTAAGALATGSKLGGLGSGAAAGSGAASSLALVAAKWVAVGVLGGGILAAGVDFAVSPRPAHVALQARAQDSANSRALPATAAKAAGDTGPSQRALPVEPTTTALAAASASAFSVAAAPAGAARSGQLGREVELIDRVRGALAAGNARLALRELDAYTRMASTGVLDREARVLRIQALRDAGDLAAARQLTDQYLADFPDDAHAARLRAQASKAAP